MAGLLTSVRWLCGAQHGLQRFAVLVRHIIVIHQAFKASIASWRPAHIIDLELNVFADMLWNLTSFHVRLHNIVVSWFPLAVLLTIGIMPDYFHCANVYDHDDYLIVHINGGYYKC